MYAVIKKENEELLCRGCLSTDRNLTPLTNYDLYFVLLDTKELIEDYKYVNILLCWECTALLHRTQAFRQRLQHAQSILAHQISTTTLSTLKRDHKQDFDYIIEDLVTIDAKQTTVQVTIDAKQTTVQVTIESKPDIDNLLVKQDDIEIKDEIDNYEADFDNYASHEDKTPNVDGKVRKKQNKTEREKRDIRKIASGLDLGNPDKYFSELCLSEREVEEILERERDDGDVTRPHKCASCWFRFASRTEVYIHTKNYHKKRTTVGKCRLCSLPYRTLWDLELHCWRSHPVNRCSLCGRVVARDKDKARHLEQHKYRYRCLKCNVDFENKQLFSYHEKQLHTRYVCDHCGHANSTKKSLEKHITRHHLPNKCPSCPLSFATWERLYRHTRAAHPRPGDEAYCVECDVSFPSRAKYRRHLSQAQRHRPKKKISVPCPECGKIFSRKNYMNNHMKLFHSNQSRHHCPLCDKYFVTGFSLRSHNKYVHEKIPMPKTKICSVCGRGFGTNRVLENHMRTHTGERPFACAHCAAAFAQRVALKAHLAAIHKEK